MNTKVKICGIRRREDIRAVNEALPDYMGFIFVKGKRRYIEPEQALGLRKLLRPEITPVGVFLDEDPQEVIRIARSKVIDMIQLHGHEDEDYIQQIKAETQLPVIKALIIKDEADIHRANQSAADLVLLDGGVGEGKTFAWSLLKKMHRPYLLAGGLDPSNIAQAVREMRPYGVDVSSGVETDGWKDPEKIKMFVKNVRSTCADMI